jgi:hypothetical protein
MQKNEQGATKVLEVQGHASHLSTPSVTPLYSRATGDFNVNSTGVYSKQLAK